MSKHLIEDSIPIPQAPDALEFNHPSHLVLEYDWLVFLNQFRVSPTKFFCCSKVAKFLGKIRNALKWIF